jgi:hypothetical protein
LGRNVPNFEIKPTACEIEGEKFGQMFEPQFSKNVWLKPRTWLVTQLENGSYNIRRRAT